MNRFLSFLFGFLALSSSAFAADPHWFGDLYFEGNYLSGSENGVAYAHLRAGQKLGDFELYGAVRGSTDTRSDGSPLGQVFNDNFVFVGLGADYLMPVLKGFRLRAQVGNSFNLLDRSAQNAGFDYQTGLISYHEGYFGTSEFSFENYGEALYIHRYDNLILDNQFRVLYRHFETKNGSTTLGAYPITMGVIGYDTNEIFYNRFIDWRTGIRFQARQNNWVFSITPEYVAGKYIVQSHENFNEFRVLAVVYAVLF